MDASTSLGTQLSDGIAALVEKHAASVVRVDGRRGPGASGVVWSDGAVVTADHVVEVDEGIEVHIGDGRTFEATVAGRDPGTDLAVLKLAGAPGLAAPAWADAGALKVGHLVLAVARPGKTARAALGIVSAFGEGWRTPAGGRIDRYLETDIAQRPGFSGGLLVDLAGRAVGLHTTGLLRRTSHAVPTATLDRVARALLAGGRVQRAYLGIGTYPVRLPRALAESTGQPTALLVVSVQAESPADRAGLALGDVLVALDGTPLRNVRDLLGLLDEERVGKEATLKVARSGALREVKVAIGVRP